MYFERKLLIFVTAALAGLGLLMVYSSSITARPSFADQKYLTRQLMFLAAGVVAAAIASRVPAEWWRKAVIPITVLTALLLVLVLVPGIGTRINGAQRWFRIGSFSVQPAELAKIAVVLYMAWAISRRADRIHQLWRGSLPMMAVPAVLSGLVLAEPDFGTAVFLITIAAMMLFLGGVPVWHLCAFAAAALPACGALVISQPYRVKRIFEFIRGLSDPSAAPYQVQQSLVALGSGGLWGTGLGKGWQKMGFLPEANTDFVFAVVGEELGLTGTLAVVGLWCVFLICGVRLARLVNGRSFLYLAAMGLVCQSVLQASLNIGVVTGSLPPKGISLPFLSAGGSNLIVSLVSVGIILGLTRQPVKSFSGAQSKLSPSEVMISETVERPRRGRATVHFERRPATTHSPSRWGTG